MSTKRTDDPFPCPFLDDEERELRRPRVIAPEKRIPYQTLIGSILHQYVTGRMVERDGDRS